MVKRHRSESKRKGNRGKLIKGMTNKLPSSIFSNKFFESALREVMKGYSGIYALYKDDELYYVGLTTDLHGRMWHHLRDRHRKKWNTFKIFRIKKVDYLKDIETLILNIHKTQANRLKGRLPSKYKLIEPFKNALKVQKEDIEKVEKALRN